MSGWVCWGGAAHVDHQTLPCLVACLRLRGVLRAFDVDMCAMGRLSASMK